MKSQVYPPYSSHSAHVKLKLSVVHAGGQSYGAAVGAFVDTSVAVGAFVDTADVGAFVTAGAAVGAEVVPQPHLAPLQSHPGSPLSQSHVYLNPGTSYAVLFLGHPIRKPPLGGLAVPATNSAQVN